MQEQITQNIEKTEKFNNITFYSLVNTYILESFEIFIVMCLIKFMTGKVIDVYQVLKNSLLIGAIVLAIEYYNKDLMKNIKGSMINIMTVKLITVE